MREGRRRVVQVRGVIDEESMTDVIARVLYLRGLDSVSPITLAVDSPGGRVDQGMALVDTIRFLREVTPVHTHCIGHAAGMALVVMAWGSRGHRTCEPDASFLLTNPFTTTPRGQRNECMELSERQVAAVLGEGTGQSVCSLLFDMQRERRLTPEEAREYGIVDQIVPGFFLTD